jgi:hypothetical protein
MSSVLAFRACNAVWIDTNAWEEHTASIFTNQKNNIDIFTAVRTSSTKALHPPFQTSSTVLAVDYMANKDMQEAKIQEHKSK